jgi:hypothetical protein
MSTSTGASEAGAAVVAGEALTFPPDSWWAWRDYRTRRRTLKDSAHWCRCRRVIAAGGPPRA